MANRRHGPDFPLPTFQCADPSLPAYVMELAVRANRAADELDILVDTLPSDVTPMTRASLQEAARTAARTLDILRWCLNPDTRPVPEGMGADVITTTHTRVWFFSAGTQSFTEVGTRDEPQPRDAVVSLRWILAPGVSGHHVIADLGSRLLGVPVEVSTNTHLMCEWEVSHIRTVLAHGSLSPILAHVLRRVFAQALENDTSAMPAIGLRVSLMRKRGVASA